MNINNITEKYIEENIIQDSILNDVSDLLEDIDTLKLKISRGIVNSKQILNKKDKNEALKYIEDVNNKLNSLYNLLENSVK